MTVAFAVAALIGAFVYGAIFVALGAATSRGLIIGLGYTLLWEGLLAGALKGTQVFSVREYIRGIASAIAPEGAVSSVVGAQAFLLTGVVIIIAAAIAATRLSRHEIRAGD